jgi:putative peptidoglycan lipid II flippase
MENDHSAESKKTASDSVIIMVCTLISRLLGIVKARAIATVFGASGVADIINFTFNIPNNFRKLFAEGALSSAYIPVFTSQLTEDHGDIRSTSQLFARMQGFQLLFMIPLILFTWIWRIEIVSFLSDFSDPKQIVLSGKLLIYFMVFLGSISFAALYGGILQSHGSFFTAAAAPLIFSVSVIMSVYTLSDRYGPYAMVIGVVGGGFLQAFVTYLRLRSFGYRMHLSFAFSYEPFRTVMKSWAPVTLTASVAIITQQVAFYFASTLSEGTVTAFSNAIIIWQAPYGIFYSAIATVFFPAMVTAFHKNQTEQLSKLIHRGLIYIATFLIPCAILLTALRFETTAVLLQSGRFELADTMRTGSILFWFTLGMPIVAWYGFLQRVCFSTSRFTSTLIVGVIVSLIDVVIMWAAISLNFGPQSLSFANTLSFFIGVILLWIVAYRTGKVRVDVKMYLHSLGKLSIANVPLIILAIGYSRFTSHSWWQSGSTLGNGLILVALSLIGIITTFISYRLIKIEFLGVLMHKER